MADEYDDDAFGEFTFASNHTMLNSSSKIQATTTGDDDWGDFSFFQNKTTDHNLKSPQPQPQPPPQPKWEKTNGALPLSLFGDDLEEENKDEKPVMPVAGDDVKEPSFSSNSGFVSNNNNINDKNNANLGINDLIANLYGPRQQQQSTKAADNGNELDLIGVNPTVSKDPFSNSDSLSSSSLHTVAAAAGSNGSDDEGGWEFIDAFSDSKLAQNEKKNNKEPSEKALFPQGIQGGSHGPIDLFASPNNGVSVETNVTSQSTSFQNGFTVDFKADFKGTTNESTSNPLGESDDFEDSFGGFETAFMEQQSSNKELSEERFDPLGSHNTSHGPVDIFAFSNGVPGVSHKENNGVDFSQTSVVQNGVDSDLLSKNEWKKTKDEADSQPPRVGADDENFGKFETTIPEAESKPEGSELSSKNYKEAVPLSIFGIEEDPETDNSLNFQQELFKSSTKHARNQRSNLSINDILSDLYSQSESISSANHQGNPDGNIELLDTTDNEYSSHKLDNNNNNDDDFNDNSWEFKDASASSLSTAENQNLSFEKKLNNCTDLYSNLKDDLCVLAKHHLHGLDDNLERIISLEKYIETLNEPYFQLLESEYHISTRLSLAESDLQTAINLINHFTTVLKILKLAPKGEPANYVSLWFKVISVCSQELKHGTLIWKQSLENNLHHQILSDLQGKQFIIALGEIYRTVLILGAAVKFYKPWILLSGADLSGIFGLLEECESIWSTSGLEEFIPVDSLLKSIRHIRNLDELAISIQVLSQEELKCRLSLLSPGIVPAYAEMKMVIWNGDKYFVTLANLWGNLISPEPPKISIQVA